MHFREHHEAILRWSWKLFCAKWARLIQAMARQRERQHQAHEEAELAKLSEANQAGNHEILGG